VTKEASAGKWKEKYVKSFSETISADGCVLTDGDSDIPTYDQLKELQMKGAAIEATYSLRDGNSRTGKTTGGYKGKYIITSLELDGQAGDDAKYSLQLENSGKVEKVGDGLTGSVASEDE
jgi:predicted secreted protein